MSEIEDADNTQGTLQPPHDDVTPDLKDITTLLYTVVKRMDNTESTLRNCCSSSSSYYSESADKSKTAEGTISLVGMSKN